MNDTYRFQGRANPAIIEFKPESIQAEPGHVLCLILTVANLEFVSYYTRLAVIDYWGMRLANPFRRMSRNSSWRDFAQYLDKDLFIYSPARLEMIPEEEWMRREA
jgi:hypothetical protein